VSTEIRTVLKFSQEYFSSAKREYVRGKSSEEIVRIRVHTTSLKLLRNQVFVQFVYVCKDIRVQVWTITFLYSFFQIKTIEDCIEPVIV
jgi:hypothetical protein